MILPKNEQDLLLKIYIGQGIREEGIVENSLLHDEKNYIANLLEKDLIQKSTWKAFRNYELYITTEKGNIEINDVLQDLLYQSDLAEEISKVPLIFLKLCFFNEKSFYHHDSDIMYYEFYWDDGIKEFLVEKGIKFWDILVNIFKKKKICVESYYYVSTGGGKIQGVRNILPEPEIKQFLKIKLGITEGLSKELINDLAFTRQDIIKKRENLLFDQIIEDYSPKYAKPIKTTFDKSKLVKVKEVNRVLVFLSHATKDEIRFGIRKIAEKLTLFNDIQDALFWEEDTKDNIIKYMDEYLGKCDVFVLFCSPNALDSDPVKNEWTAAEMLKKPIIPIYVKIEHIPPLLRPRLSVEFDMFNFNDFVEKLHDLIIKKTK